MKQKLALQQAGAEDSDAESDSEDEDENWGGKKKVYYGDEEVDVDVRSTTLLLWGTTPLWPPASCRKPQL